jgi:hypothetical protein
LGLFIFSTPLSEYFQKSGHARTPLNGSTLKSTLQYVLCISAVLNPTEFAGGMQV